MPRTPGIWAAKQAHLPVDGEFDWCVSCEVNGTTYVIIEAFGRVSETVRPDAEANARLAAAAPEMFEALRSLENDAGQMPDFMWRMVQDAVEKAGGTRKP